MLYKLVKKELAKTQIDVKSTKNSLTKATEKCYSKSDGRPKRPPIFLLFLQTRLFQVDQKNRNIRRADAGNPACLTDGYRLDGSQLFLGSSRRPPMAR